MILKRPQLGSRGIIVFFTITCVYLPLGWLYLFFSDSIYDIGKIYCICLISSAEFINTANGKARTVTIFCVLTCIYLPLYLLYLLYNGSSYISIITTICSAEYIKFILNLLFIDSYFKNIDYEVLTVKKLLVVKLREILKCLYLLTCSTVMFYALAVLFGAPLLSKYKETLTFALVLTSLTILPFCLHLGADKTTVLLMDVDQRENAMAGLMLRNIKLTLFTAWACAIVIPLDWNRPWQLWPLPCCTGAILGYTASHVLVFVENVFKCVFVPHFLI